MLIWISTSSVTLEMYHGSPYGDIDLTTSKGLYLTRSIKVAKDYALGRVFNTGKGSGVLKPTVYKILITGNIFDLRSTNSRYIYETARLKTKDKFKDDPLPKLDSIGFIMNSGLPSYGTTPLLKRLLQPLGFDGTWVDDGSHGISLYMFNCKNCILKDKSI